MDKAKSNYYYKSYTNLIICGFAHGCKLPSATEYKIKNPKFDTEKTSNKTGQFKNSSLESPLGVF